MLLLAVLLALCPGPTAPGWACPSPLPVIAGPLVALGLVLLLPLTGRLAGGRMMLPLALLAMVAVALAFPQRFHLWGDGALRIRNLLAGIRVTASGALEPGDTLIHLLMVRLGLPPEGSFAITGLLAGSVYAGCLLLPGMRPGGRGEEPWLWMVWLSPAWIVFFTGYVESYSLYAAFATLLLCMILTGASMRVVVPVSALCCFLHMMGLLLLPSVLAHWWLRRRTASPDARESAMALLLVPIACLALLWLRLSGALTGLWAESVPAGGGITGGAPAFGNRFVSSVGYSARQLSSVLLFTAPALPLMIFFAERKDIRRRAIAALPTVVACLLLLILWKPAHGFMRDWDLMAVLLLPVFVPIAASMRFRTVPARAIAAAALLLGSVRMATFHSPEVSLERFELSLSAEPSAAAFEELGILYRDSGDPGRASGLFRRAFEHSGNGRFLAQASEVERAMGNPEEALDLALLAVAERPDLPVAHLQLLYSAAEAGRPALAVDAAMAACSLGGDDPLVWGKALEAAVIAGRTDLALFSAERCLACGADTLPEVVTNLGVLSYQLGRHMQAGSLFERA